MEKKDNRIQQLTLDEEVEFYLPSEQGLCVVPQGMAGRVNDFVTKEMQSVIDSLDDQFNEIVYHCIKNELAEASLHLEEEGQLGVGFNAHRMLFDFNGVINTAIEMIEEGEDDEDLIESWIKVFRTAADKLENAMKPIDARIID